MPGFGGLFNTRAHARGPGVEKPSDPPRPLLGLVDVLHREDPTQGRLRRAGTAVGVRAQPRHDADPVPLSVAAADRAAGAPVPRCAERRDGRVARPAVGERPLQDGHVALAHLVEGDHVGLLRTDHRSRPVDGPAGEAAGETAVAQVQLQHTHRVALGHGRGRARHEETPDQAGDDRRRQPHPGTPPLRHRAPRPTLHTAARPEGPDVCVRAGFFGEERPEAWRPRRKPTTRGPSRPGECCWTGR